MRLQASPPAANEAQDWVPLLRVDIDMGSKGGREVVFPPTHSTWYRKTLQKQSFRIKQDINSVVIITSATTQEGAVVIWMEIFTIYPLIYQRTSQCRGLKTSESANSKSHFAQETYDICQ